MLNLILYQSRTWHKLAKAGLDFIQMHQAGTCLCTDFLRLLAAHNLTDVHIRVASPCCALGVLGALLAGAATAPPPPPTLTANPFAWPTFVSRLAKPAEGAKGPGGPFLSEMVEEASQQQQQDRAAKEGAAKLAVVPSAGPRGGQSSQRWKNEDVEADVMEAVAGGLLCIVC